VCLGGRHLDIGDVTDVAAGLRGATLSDDPGFARRIQRGAARVAAMVADGERVYGISTGYGDSHTVRIPAEQIAELPLQLTRYHGCGLGRHLSPEATRATMLVRANSLALGFSGVRLELLERLLDLLGRDILPLIPEEGSVGASGDLTPLSYVAAALVGEREVIYRGERTSAAAALDHAGLEPLRLAPKEGLALMNGTSVMTALGCLAWTGAARLAELGAVITALASLALHGNPRHFHPRLFEMKPHPGQGRSAARIWELLGGETVALEAPGQPLQDRYSIRCAPHVLGVLEDSLDWTRGLLETELNSANDNPLIDPDSGEVYHGGHFYGGHVAQAMDTLKTAVANVADLLDRQMALLVDPRYSNGLPRNLGGLECAGAASSHGLKALQISVSAWTAEALKLTMPASVFSRSTECHNQDKVSMGTIAARDALRVTELTEQVAAALLLTVCQAVEIRWQRSELPREAPHPDLARAHERLRRHVAFVGTDRALEPELRALLEAIRGREIV
jgi:histidine ammonia-lyase